MKQNLHADCDLVANLTGPFRSSRFPNWLLPSAPTGSNTIHHSFFVRTVMATNPTRTSCTSWPREERLGVGREKGTKGANKHTTIWKGDCFSVIIHSSPEKMKRSRKSRERSEESDKDSDLRASPFHRHQWRVQMHEDELHEYLTKYQHWQCQQQLHQHLETKTSKRVVLCCSVSELTSCYQEDIGPSKSREKRKSSTAIQSSWINKGNSREHIQACAPTTPLQFSSLHQCGLWILCELLAWELARTGSALPKLPAKPQLRHEGDRHQDL